ncbi:MAG: tetratricopeptide repeat protein [Candidatus Auribacterota bacterium]|jgi:tetratricopeptide (TPR) repeat protein|nr:tetratricopeptide repeat protein [Candidatus Auribacterota bacterium]
MTHSNRVISIYNRFLSFLHTKQRVACFLLLAAVLLVYANVINGGFVYDDKSFIVDNRPVKEWLFSRPWDFFIKPEVAVWSGIYRPLRTLSFAIDYQLFGLNPVGYHCENVLLHCINTLLVFSILSVLLACTKKGFLGALLFAVHPVQLEAVSWISSRGDLLFALFVLISFKWYISMTDDERIKWTSISGLLLLYIFALLSKETAIAFFPVVISYDILIMCCQKKINLYYMVKKRLKIYLSIAGISLLYLIIRFNLFESVSQKPYWGGSVKSNILTMLEATLYYFKIIFYPVKLSIDYSNYPIIYSFADIRLIMPVLFYTAVALLCFYALRRKDYPFILFAGIFVLFLLPSWNIFPISAIIAERFLYVSLIGVAAVAGCVLYTICFENHTIFQRKICFLTVLFIFLCLSFLSIYRNSHWFSNYTIWKACVDVFPGNYKGHINLGTEYEEKGEHYKAISENIKLLVVKPHHATAHYNLGNIYWRLGLFDKSRAAFLTAIRYNPEYWQAMNNLGSLYVDKMWYDEAERVFLQLIVKNPDYPKAHFNLASIYFNRFKDYPKAKYHLRKCIESEMFRNSKEVHFMWRNIEIIDRETSGIGSR